MGSTSVGSCAQGNKGGSYKGRQTKKTKKVTMKSGGEERRKTRGDEKIGMEGEEKNCEKRKE